MTPRATYRLQLTPAFGFRDAAAIVPYLADLGVSHLYLSPVLRAAPGSTHGYDVVDHETVNVELGGEEAFADLCRVAKEHGLGILLDIVPNHMSIAGSGNKWWNDVLENGPASYYSSYFDIDWGGTDDRVLLPVLGDRYGRSLVTGVLGVLREGDAYFVRAGEHHFPLSPRTLGPLIRRAGDNLDHAELAYIGEALSHLPDSHERDPSARRRRHRHKAVLLARLAELRQAASVSDAIDRVLADMTADVTQLDALLEQQNYRLAHWTVAGAELGYRRFFDITTLVGVRAEDPDVFTASHARVAAWLRDGAIDGVRVDHIDGLRDPDAYTARLRALGGEGAWIVVEKILAAGESLPETWPIDGTTGYEFADDVTRLLVDPAGEAALTATFTAYTQLPWQPDADRRTARHEVLSDALHSELSRLTDLAVKVCATSPACRDYTRAEIEAVLVEILAGYRVYRTYLGTHDRPIDRSTIEDAAATASEVRPDLDADLVAFISKALAFELPNAEGSELASVAQQTTGPVVAKGDEDTLSYRGVRLAARSEVGADISIFASAPEVVHASLATRRPRSLLATSTHDTKRTEDTRARLAVLSEMPDRWAIVTQAWGERCAHHWGDVPRDRLFEYTMWQALVGAHPLSRDRAQRYAEKATREARTRTSWRKPDDIYETARRYWIDALFEDHALLDEIGSFAAHLSPHAERNSLAQLTLKLCAPGVPDFYQGCELASYALVDPDNRERVDYGLRTALLRDADRASDLDRSKLHVTRRLLALRKGSPEIFAGAYAPLAAIGPHAHRVFAFTRGDSLVCIVPRLGVAADTWADTLLALPSGTWRDVLTDRLATSPALRDIWAELPVAVLCR
ncbi:MAG TPA: malto-oligosyltrehalose synthase [Kofleriaceae bacterium]|jgi:(1->4)-alpha-D-glucan 1-alpha-D-glucosylmutase